MVNPGESHELEAAQKYYEIADQVWKENHEELKQASAALRKAKESMTQLEGSVETAFRQLQRAHMFLNKVELHLEVVEIDNEEEPPRIAEEAEVEWVIAHCKDRDENEKSGNDSMLASEGEESPRKPPPMRNELAPKPSDGSADRLRPKRIAVEAAKSTSKKDNNAKFQKKTHARAAKKATRSRNHRRYIQDFTI
jgi:exonuclease VII small subunit